MCPPWDTHSPSLPSRAPGPGAETLALRQIITQCPCYCWENAYSGEVQVSVRACNRRAQLAWSDEDSVSKGQCLDQGGGRERQRSQGRGAWPTPQGALRGEGRKLFCQAPAKSPLGAPPQGARCGPSPAGFRKAALCPCPRPPLCFQTYYCVLFLLVEFPTQWVLHGHSRHSILKEISLECSLEGLMLKLKL